MSTDDERGTYAVPLRRRTADEQLQWLTAHVAVLEARVNALERHEALFAVDDVRRLMAGLELMRSEGRWLSPRVLKALEVLHRVEQQRPDQ